MSQQQFFINDNSPPPGFLTKLTPDSGIAVVPDGSDNISIKGIPTGVNQSTDDSNFETFNAGASQMQIAHRYQGKTTTSDGAGQTQTILTFPMTVSTTATIHAEIAGIEGTPDGVGGSISGVVFRGGAGAFLVGKANKYFASSDLLGLIGSDIDINVSGNNAIVTVTGSVGKIIEWYCIATIVTKTFI